MNEEYFTQEAKALLEEVGKLITEESAFAAIKDRLKKVYRHGASMIYSNSYTEYRIEVLFDERSDKKLVINVLSEQGWRIEEIFNHHGLTYALMARRKMLNK